MFQKFSKNIQINYETKITISDKIGQSTTHQKRKTIKLINWEQCKQIIKARIISLRTKQKKHLPLPSLTLINKAIDEISNVTVNWRTKYKLSQYCAICGSPNQIQYHHVKHVKIGKTEGFLQILKQLNRK